MESKVVFVDSSLKKGFEELVGVDPRLAKEINRAITEIAKDYSCGRHVKKQLIPKQLTKKYRITNLWIYNLRKDWRLLYSIHGNQVELIAIVLDWMNHKQYERLFKYT